MMKQRQSRTYLEQCIEAVSTIDAEELAERRLGEVAGYGSGFTTYRLGELANGYVGPIATKLPNPGVTSLERVLNEIPDMQLLAGSDRRLRACLPSFLGLLSVRGQYLGILTEDVSVGGRRPLESCTLPPDIEAAITLQAPDGAVFNVRARKSLAHRAGEDIRLLDMTPPPFVGGTQKRTELYYDTLNALVQLSVAVPADSPLGKSLVSQLQSS